MRVHGVVEVRVHVVVEPVGVSVGVWLVGASEMLVLTIGSGVLGGSRSHCACVAFWLGTPGLPFYFSGRGVSFKCGPTVDLFT
jgi:hypothetical protein